jgi:hypothetical protein
MDPALHLMWRKPGQRVAIDVFVGAQNIGIAVVEYIVLEVSNV